MNQQADMQNGWEKWENRKNTVMVKYKTELCVIISKGKLKYLYITEKVLKSIGNPKMIDIFTRGNNIAIMGATDEGSGYKLHEVSEETDRTTAYIQPSALLKNYHCKPGVYQGHVEGSMFIFDIAQQPARL
jgi:hypothetical protein